MFRNFVETVQRNIFVANQLLRKSRASKALLVMTLIVAGYFMIQTFKKED